MFWMSKNRGYPIGVDMGDDAIKLAQLSDDGNKGLTLVYGNSKNRPKDVKPGTGEWQRWAIHAISELLANGKFQGRKVIAAIPADEIFVDHIKMPNSEKGKVDQAIAAKIKQKIPFDPADAMIRHFETEQDNLIVMATQREKINRHLAIYEKSNLQLQSISVWPYALTSSYAGFFGRRKADVDAVVILIDVCANYTNVVICRHKSLLFVRSIPIGTSHFGTEQIMTRLTMELKACKKQFGSIYGDTQIERLIFLSGQSVEREVYTIIAKQLELPAQIGDCLTAVQIDNPIDSGIDRRESVFSWATAFGLSLS